MNEVIQRFPKNVVGDFYTTGMRDKNGDWCGDCLSCEAPESEAPNLLAKLTDDNGDTYFVKQPVTNEEIKDAISATKVCCVDALRYGGKDKTILKKMDKWNCDFVIAPNGEVIPNQNKADNTCCAKLLKLPEQNKPLGTIVCTIILVCILVAVLMLYRIN